MIISDHVVFASAAVRQRVGAGADGAAARASRPLLQGAHLLRLLRGDALRPRAAGAQVRG